MVTRVTKGGPIMVTTWVAGLLLLFTTLEVKGQFDKPKNANPFVDSMIEEVVKTMNESLPLPNEEFIIVLDLLFLRPELQLQVYDGTMSGMKSLARSDDALLTYSEETGAPVFTISTSLIISNVTVKSGAQGQARGVLGFSLNMPDILLDVLVESVDISTVIEVDIGDLDNIKPGVKDVQFNDVGNINVEIIGLTPELDGLVSPISSLVVNTVKRDLQQLVTPLIRTMLEEQVRENVKIDLGSLFG
jgi:hypothetical protein